MIHCLILKRPREKNSCTSSFVGGCKPKDHLNVSIRLMSLMGEWWKVYRIAAGEDFCFCSSLAETCWRQRGEQVHAPGPVTAVGPVAIKHWQPALKATHIVTLWYLSHPVSVVLGQDRFLSFRYTTIGSYPPKRIMLEEHFRNKAITVLHSHMHVI